MIIDPQFRKCVTYLFLDLKDDDTGKIDRKPIATAFFVCVPILGGNAQAVYIVTARHTIRRSRPYGTLSVRFNLTDGSYIDMPSPQDNWSEHPTTDVAVCATLVPVKHDTKWLPISMFENQKFIIANTVREGDDVFFCGMFKPFPGIEKMQPLIRFGNISLMPYEKIYLQDSPEDAPYLADAYLVEARSWGGHSGSPTFLYFKPDRNPGTINIVSGAGGPPTVLLGLVSSHYQLQEDVRFQGDVLGSGKVDINAGIATVIPARFISELLLGDEYMEQRKGIEEILKQKVHPLKPEINIEEAEKIELSKKEFEEVLRKISRPPKPDGQ
jgi:hypothetical protein